MSLHHPGRVIAVHAPATAKSADTSVQATLEMWDENVLTLTVEPKIAKDMKAGDTVLVDYSPTSVGRTTVQRQVVVKILPKNTADQIWKIYKDYYDKLRQLKAAKATAAAIQQAAQSAEYFG
jgi:hypothetical protein